MSCIFPNRIYAQYRSKPKAVAWYSIVPTIANEFCATYDAISCSYDIDTNSGAQLDVIGRVVGVSRNIILETEIPYVGYGAAQYGSNQYQSYNLVNNIAVADSLYRVLLRSKIAKNTNDATIDGIITALETIVKNNKVILNDNEDMSFNVEFEESLSDDERYMLTNFDIVPKPQGVRFTGFTELPSLTQYGGRTGQYGDSRAQYSGSYI